MSITSWLNDWTNRWNDHEIISEIFIEKWRTNFQEMNILDISLWNHQSTWTLNLESNALSIYEQIPDWSLTAILRYETSISFAFWVHKNLQETTQKFHQNFTHFFHLNLPFLLIIISTNFVCHFFHFFFITFRLAVFTFPPENNLISTSYFLLQLKTKTCLVTKTMKESFMNFQWKREKTRNI